MLSEKHTGLDFATALIEDTVLPGELLPKEEAVVQKETQDPQAQRSMAASPVDELRVVSRIHSCLTRISAPLSFELRFCNSSKSARDEMPQRNLWTRGN